MNLTTTVARTPASNRGSARLRHAGSLLGGALIGTSIMAPILAGGDTVDGDAFVIFFSGLLAVLGIGMHVAGSGGAAHAVPMTAPVPTSDPDYSKSARVMRDASADTRLIV